MTDRERALEIIRGCPNIPSLLDALLEAEARGVEWAYKRFKHSMLANRAAELRAQMSEPK